MHRYSNNLYHYIFLFYSQEYHFCEILFSCSQKTLTYYILLLSSSYLLYLTVHSTWLDIQTKHGNRMVLLLAEVIKPVVQTKSYFISFIYYYIGSLGLCTKNIVLFVAFFVFLTVYDVSMKQFIFHSIENISDSN